MVVPLAPQSTTRDEARPDAKEVSTGSLAMNTAGGECFSKSAWMHFSRAAGAQLGGSASRIGCSFAATASRFFSA